MTVLCTAITAYSTFAATKKTDINSDTPRTESDLKSCIGISYIFFQDLKFSEQHPSTVAVVSKVKSGLPANDLLQKGDIIISVNGQPLESLNSVSKIVSNSELPNANLTV